MKELIQSIVLTGLLGTSLAANGDTVASLDIPNRIANKCELLERGDILNLWLSEADGVPVTDPDAFWEGSFATVTSAGVPGVFQPGRSRRGSLLGQQCHRRGIDHSRCRAGADPTH